MTYKKFWNIRKICKNNNKILLAYSYNGNKETFTVEGIDKEFVIKESLGSDEKMTILKNVNNLLTNK